MSAFKFVILFCVFAVAYCANDSPHCRREPGDELLETIPFISIVVAGQGTLNRSYNGYKITCVQCISLLGDVGTILDITVLQGGYGCSSVLAQITVNNLVGSCQVYGRRLRHGETVNC